MERKKAKGRTENLIPLASRPPEEQHAIRSKGGKNSKEAWKKRKNAQESMRAILSSGISASELRERYGEKAELLGDDPSLMDELNLVQVLEAREGSAKAYELVRDTAGFKPVEQLQAEVNTMSDNDRELLERVAKRTGLKAE